MIFRLVIEEGPRQGEEFVIKDEIILGRNSGDLQLKDPKASKQHAKIAFDSSGSSYIQDLDSSNGTLLNGVKIRKQYIKPGDVIVIGKTKIKVEPYVAPEQSTSEIEKGSWQYDVDEALSEALKSAENSKPTQRVSQLFNPMVTLEFIKGPQVGSSFTFAFGPRKVGAACADALLLEPDCPKVAFELVPKEKGHCLINVKSDLVRVNGLETTGQTLQDGDEISIGRTVIKLRALTNS